MTTGDALLNEIAAHPLEMTLRLAYLDWAAENSDVMREAIRVSMVSVPPLSTHGVGISWVRGESSEEHLARFSVARQHLLDLTDQFVLCVAWLADKRARSSVDYRTSSYAYKHRVEDYFMEHVVDSYVCNGAFIAAAVHRGFPFAYGRDCNMSFGISRRFMIPKEQEEEGEI